VAGSGFVHIGAVLHKIVGTDKDMVKLMKNPLLGIGLLCGLLLAPRASTVIGSELASAQNVPTSASEVSARVVLDQYCVSCHNQELLTGGLSLDDVDPTQAADDGELWERVILKLRGRTMPPAGMQRPDEATYDALASQLEAAIDQAWAVSPRPGRMDTVHRLNRTEYNNAVRDLFKVDLDVRSMLPGDETADGSFDNIAEALSVTTTHLERYITVARHVTRLAVGLPPVNPEGVRHEVHMHLEQDSRLSEDLPLGSRGGTAIRYQFPVDGEYLIKVELRRNYQRYIMGMGWAQEVEIRLDNELLGSFTVGEPPEGALPATRSYAGGGFGDREWEDFMQVEGDEFLEVRVPVTAGSHLVSASFVRDLWEPEWALQPRQRGRPFTVDEQYMHHAAVHTLQVQGPFEVAELASDTPSREAIFVCHPDRGAEEQACAQQILTSLARRAYRGMATERDIQNLLQLFDSEREAGGSFDEGIQFALEGMLASPSFLLRVYHDPESAEPGDVYPLTDLELASRLSFFLWSSIPDDTLLELAERGELSDPEILEQQARRLLDDPRAADALVGDFASQWLNLRRMDDVTADDRFYPTYDVNLRDALRQETELFLRSTVREDRGVLELLTADYTFVNERLARHYGIPDVYGSRFRRVLLPDLEQRGGLLGHGSLLAVSSYSDRTSPVLRGKWLLDNILGTPAPPPPPGVDTNLEDPEGVKPRSIREKLEQHRENAVCASCHSTIDPLGFALENYDVVGGWRVADEWGNPVDSAGGMPDGSKVVGLAGLRGRLVERSDAFVSNVISKLMSYALARRVEYYDRPAVRKILRDSAAENHSWSSLVVGIVTSPGFRMREARAAETAD
jgi:hypothetical protein